MKKILIITIIVFFTCACQDLDLYPLSEGSNENWFSDDAELEMAVINVFNNSFWDGYAPVDFFYNSDDYLFRTKNTTIVNGAITGQSSEVTDAWDNCYKCIARANAIIENYEKVEGLTDEKLNLYLANVKFAIATMYSKLIFLWGDVPYYEGTLDIEEAFSMGRTNKNEILTKIYEDYNFAIANLPLEYTSSEYLFATKGAAMAFKARIALYMGDYDIARDAAKACIDLGVYELFPDYRTLFLSKTKNSVETIFSTPYSLERARTWWVRDFLTRTAGGNSSRNPTFELFFSYLCTDGLPIDESPLFNPREPFKNRDPRCAATIVEFGTNWMGFTYNPHPDTLMVLNHNTGKLVDNKDNRAVVQWCSYNGLAWAKHIDEDYLDLRSENDNLIMRYADVLLMYAEAKIELGEIDDSVLDAMNQVRARAYKVEVTDVSSYPAITETEQNKLRRILRTERRMEFAKENTIRYNDILRWRIAEKVLNLPQYGILDVAQLREEVVNQGLWFLPEAPSIDEDGVVDLSPLYEKGLIRFLSQRNFDPAKHYLWPIPTTEIQINENMTQNPGY